MNAAIVIGSNEVLVGSLSSRALELVTEWASLHRVGDRCLANGADLDLLVLHGDFEPASRLVHH